MSEKYLLLKRKYSTNKKILLIDCYKEYKNNSVDEVIMFEINAFSKKESIVMLLDVYSLRSLSIAIQQSLKNQSFKFKKYTQSGSNKKSLFVAKTQKALYVNMKDSNYQISFPFGFIGAASFAIELEHIAKHLSTKIFEAQEALATKQSLHTIDTNNGENSETT